MSKEYDEYLSEHKNAVRECLKLLALEPTPVKGLTESKIEMITQMHDASKFSVDEYDGYDCYFYGVKDERPETQEKFDRAWLHHIHNNPHHWQHWVLVEDDSGSPKTIKIPEIYLVEMVADWGSFAYRKQIPLELKEWYDAHKDKIVMHSESKAKVQLLVDHLIDKMKCVFSEDRQV